MGLFVSRLNCCCCSVSLNPSRNRSQRSQHEDPSYNYSFSKNNFSNYFFMGGERFEINEPGYLFGDNFDLNFLGCTKPHHFPYKKAKQSILSNLHNINSKQCSDISSGRVNSSSLIKILPRCRHKRDRNVSSNDNNNDNNNTNNNKRDAQTQTTNGTNNNNTGSKGYGLEPSRPIEMLINIRKETLRLIKSSNANQCESDLDSVAIDMEQPSPKTKTDSHVHPCHGDVEYKKPELNPDGKKVKPIDNSDDEQGSNIVASPQRKKARALTAEEIEAKRAANGVVSPQRRKVRALTEQEIEARQTSSAVVSPRRDKARAIIDQDDVSGNTRKVVPTWIGSSHEVGYVQNGESSPWLKLDGNLSKEKSVYNIEFNFDAEVNCSIRIFYLCTREVTQSGINYKPQHATYKSKLYHFKQGLNQKFDQRDHTFQPCLFDEDLLAYKPAGVDGLYNSKAIYPIVIHCIAVDGPIPRQSQSLIATIEKSQSDDSYTIKPLKQLIFVDGVQFILQDIYGAENKDLLCVICMSEGRDTMLLPCRHLCLCSPCAQSLTNQANSCPICRRSFKAALNLQSEIKDE